MSSARANNNNNNSNNRRRRNRNSSSRNSESRSPSSPTKQQQTDERSSPRIPSGNERDRMSPTSKCIREWGFAYYNSRSGNPSSDDENSSSRSRNSSESSEDGAHYAGAKFNSTPPASMLPLPPSHWLEEMYQNTKRVEKRDSLSEMSTHLRQLLNVSA
jgi:hypothetical protein